MSRLTRDKQVERNAADAVLDAVTRLRRLVRLLDQYSHVPLIGSLARVVRDALDDVSCASRALEALAGGGRFAPA
jgi:hypothetical protein